MADYPSTTFTPTTKNTGDTIAAAHVNALQAEVTAIEAALLNSGLAHTLKFVHGTYDIGATAGTFAPRDLFLTRNATIGGSVSVSAADGVRDNAYVGSFANLEATAGRSFGIFVQAGSNASDYALFLRSTAGTDLGFVDGAGTLRLNAYTAATFVAGDKYLVVDANGVVHRSADGPAS